MTSAALSDVHGGEADADDTNRKTVIRDLVEGQYSHPVRIAAFNTAEGWSRDVTVTSPTLFVGVPSTS
jgi:hypothetical protein